jgi:hypothetical protein
MSHHRMRSILTGIAVALPLTITVWAGAAHAKAKGDSVAADSKPSDDNTEEAPPRRKDDSADSASPSDPSSPAAPAPNPSFVERLTGSAFPSPKVRGLYNGSLWMTSHGLQWPYMAKTGIGVSGYAWVDTGYEQIRRGENHPNTKYWLQQARANLRLTPTYTDGRFFVQSQVELIANKDQSVVQPNVADTDDLWLKVGVWNLWDLQVGRFEGWELFHLGMGLDLNTLERNGAIDVPSNTLPDFYGVTDLFYRPKGVGNVALHLYPTDYLRFELLGQVGNENGYESLGTRPSAILDFGFLRLKGGAEYRRVRDVLDDVVPALDPVTMAPILNPDGSQKQIHVPRREVTIAKGAGGSIQFIFNPYVEGGFSAAEAHVEHTDRQGGIDGKGSYWITSYGGFVNIRTVEDLLLGGGVVYTFKDDAQVDMNGVVGHYSNLQAYGALQYTVAKQLIVKGVFAYALGTFDPSFDTPEAPINYENIMLSGRVRLMYLF